MTSAALPEACDVAVIGAGLGGLTAAALLAKAGLSVCVLEMDRRPGGYLAGFDRAGYHFDTSIQWLNQCGAGGSVRRALELIGPTAPATRPLHRIRRYKSRQFDYLLTDRPDDLRDQLIADFPHEREGLCAFFAAARSVGSAFEKVSRYLRTRETWSVWDYARSLGALRHGLKFLRYMGPSIEKGLKRFFDDPRLASIFCTEQNLTSCLVPIGWAYGGDYQMPPAGGTEAIPQFLCQAVRAWAGTVGLGCRVTDVLLDGRRAVGVRFESAGIRHEVRSRYVVAACDLETIYEHALPTGTIDADLIARLHDADLYQSSVSVWLGLDRPAEELGFGEELTFLTRGDVGRAEHNSSDPHTSAISVIAPSARDATAVPKGMGSLALSVSARMAYGDCWRTEPGRRRGEAYQKFKQEYAEVLIDRVAQELCPSLRQHVRLCEVATPLTYWRYTGNRDGTTMAASPTRRNMRAHVAQYRTPVQNLLLGGHWAEYGGGVPVAVRAGCNSALIILKRERPEAYRLVRDVMDGRLTPQEASTRGLLSLPDESPSASR